MNDKQLLQRLQRGEGLHSAVLRDLAFSKGLITVDDVTNNDSPPGEKEYLFIKGNDPHPKGVSASIGAAAIRQKARCSMKRDQASLI